MGHHAAVVVVLSQLHSVGSLREGTDLVNLNQQGVRSLLFDAFLQASRVGDEEVVADDLDLVADLSGELGVALPVVFLQRILDGHDRVVLDELLVDLDHILGAVLAALEVVDALVLVVELGRCSVQGESDVLAELVAGLLHSLSNEVQSFLGGINRRSEAALVAKTRGQALGLNDGLQVVVNLRTHAESLAEGICTNRSNHEFLNVDAGVRVSTTVDDVHHRYGEYVSVRAAEVAEKLKVGGAASGLRRSQGDTEDRVRAQVGLVVRPVKIQHHLVDEALVVSFKTGHCRSDLFIDVLDGLTNALAQVAVATVAEFVSLVNTGGSTGRNACTAERSVVKKNLNLNSRVAA